MNALYDWPLPHCASELQRAYYCPTSPHRQARVPESESGPEAVEGTMLHSAVARVYQDNDYSGLNPEQAQAVMKCVEFIREIEGFGGVGFETSYFLFECMTAVKIIDMEVTPDVDIYHNAKHVSIIDFKFGRLPIPWPADKDMQLLTYSLAVHNFQNNPTYPFRVDVYRFHPRFPYDKSRHYVSYQGDREYWQRWENVIKNVIAGCTTYAVAIPGEAQCRYCRAKGICPEFQAWSVPAPIPTVPITFTKDFTPATLANVLEWKDRIALINRMWSDAEALAKRAIEAGTPVPGWELKPGNMVRKIANTRDARYRLSKRLSHDQIDDCCEFKLKALEKIFQDEYQSSAKRANEMLSLILDGLIETKQNAPSLVRKDEGQ